jgi:hypothetical protein
MPNPSAVGAAWTATAGGLAVRPQLVLVGPAAGGIAATLTVVHAPLARPPPLERLPGLVGRVGGLRAAGVPRRLALGGRPALAYDYRVAVAGRPLHARQVACVHGGELWFVTLVAAAGGFDADAAALERLTRAWRWT